jgi:hypothetical protein
MMSAEMVDVARPDYRIGRRLDIPERLGLNDAGSRLVDRERHVDFDGIKSGQFHLEAEIEQREQLIAQDRLVPSCVLGQAVEGQAQGADLGRVAVMDHDGGNLVITQVEQSGVHRMAIG